MKNSFQHIVSTFKSKGVGFRILLGIVVLGGLAALIVFGGQPPAVDSTPAGRSGTLLGNPLNPPSAQAETTHNAYNPLVVRPEDAPPPPPPTPSATPLPTPLPPASDYSLVFVSRQIPDKGSVYYTEGGMLPGTGPYSRVVVAAPGKLQILEPDSTLRTLVDGSNPQPSSYNLIDVNGPEVSYDGTKILFAGLPAGDYSLGPNKNPGGWRIFVINVDGTGLQQLTFSDRNLDLSQFNSVNGFEKYDDFDPVWLPDGRIIFATTRWPSVAMYNDSRTSNLFVMNADGSDMRRITSERNGAERPLIDPLTGRVVYSRWWRNFRAAANDMGTVEELDGYIKHIGLVAESQASTYGEGPEAALSRNSWMLTTINPDGTDIRQFAGISGIGSHAFDNQAYGGSFAADGSIYTAFYPMHHLSEAAGFGGIRHFERGPNSYRSVIGVTTDGELLRESPPSHRVFPGPYAADPEFLPDGRLAISWAADARQDYGLYRVKPDGSGRQLIYDNPGTSELRARVVAPRPVPPIIPDVVDDVPSMLPPLEDGPYTPDGTFVFNALNVYFNAPVDSEIVDAIPIGSAATIRFYIDHQRTSYGFPERLDWPILLEELQVSPEGAVVSSAPANLPLFEQIRSPLPEYEVPLTGGYSRSSYDTGAAHVAGHNFGRPGTVASCVGCHAGHTMIPVPENPADAAFTNVAPSATVTLSSSHADTNNEGRGLIDRRVTTGEGTGRYWASGSTSSLSGEWILLTFPVPIQVKTVRLHPLPAEGTGLEASFESARVILLDESLSAPSTMSNSLNQLTEAGTDVHFDNIWTTAVRVELDGVQGGSVGLAEIEVIAKVGANP